MTWHPAIDSRYWYYASLFMAKFYGHAFWDEQENGELVFCISLNDVFCPASDAHEVKPNEMLEYLELVTDKESKDGYNDVIKYIANLRGETKFRQL